ncbi:GhoT/OrtT family toxin [Escherichia coli]|nr:GhoT/OrtT family toxin [Escherichia coli]
MALFSKILIFYVIGVNISFVIIWFISHEKTFVIIWFISHEKTHIRLLSAFLVGITWPMSLPVALLFSLF